MLYVSGGPAPLRSPHADLAAADVCAQLPGLQGGRRGLLEHLTPLDRGQPEAVSVGVVVARPAAVALDEWCAAELLQTRAGGRQGLAGAFSAGAGVHDEGVANPEGGPAIGARRDLDGLAVHGHHHGWRLTHRTPADERPDVVPGDGRHGHGHGLGRGQPVGVVVPGGKVAHVIDVAEEEGHRTELAQAAPGRA